MFQEKINNPLNVSSRRWRTGAWVVAGLAVIFIGLAMSTLIWGQASQIVYRQATGWREMARQVVIADKKFQLETGLVPFILSEDKYYTAAEMGFYMDDPSRQVNSFALGKHGLGFRFWVDLDQLEGRSALAILQKPDDRTMARLQNYFEKVEEPELHGQAEPGGNSQEFWIVVCHGYHKKPSLTRRRKSKDSD